MAAITPGPARQLRRSITGLKEERQAPNLGSPDDGFTPIPLRESVSIFSPLDSNRLRTPDRFDDDNAPFGTPHKGSFSRAATNTLQMYKHQESPLFERTRSNYRYKTPIEFAPAGRCIPENVKDEPAIQRSASTGGSRKPASVSPPPKIGSKESEGRFSTAERRTGLQNVFRAVRHVRQRGFKFRFEFLIADCKIRVAQPKRVFFEMIRGAFTIPIVIVATLFTNTGTLFSRPPSGESEIGFATKETRLIITETDLNQKSKEVKRRSQPLGEARLDLAQLVSCRGKSMIGIDRQFEIALRKCLDPTGAIVLGVKSTPLGVADEGSADEDGGYPRTDSEHSVTTHNLVNKKGIRGPVGGSSTFNLLGPDNTRAASDGASPLTETPPSVVGRVGRRRSLLRILAPDFKTSPSPGPVGELLDPPSTTRDRSHSTTTAFAHDTKNQRSSADGEQSNSPPNHGRRASLQTRQTQKHLDRSLQSSQVTSSLRSGGFHSTQLQGSNCLTENSSATDLETTDLAAGGVGGLSSFDNRSASTHSRPRRGTSATRSNRDTRYHERAVQFKDIDTPQSTVSLEGLQTENPNASRHMHPVFRDIDARVDSPIASKARRNSNPLLPQSIAGAPHLWLDDTEDTPQNRDRKNRPYMSEAHIDTNPISGQYDTARSYDMAELQAKLTSCARRETGLLTALEAQHRRLVGKIAILQTSTAEAQQLSPMLGSRNTPTSSPSSNVILRCASRLSREAQDLDAMNETLRLHLLEQHKVLRDDLKALLHIASRSSAASEKQENYHEAKEALLESQLRNVRTQLTESQNRQDDLVSFGLNE